MTSENDQAAILSLSHACVVSRRTRTYPKQWHYLDHVVGYPTHPGPGPSGRTAWRARHCLRRTHITSHYPFSTSSCTCSGEWFFSLRYICSNEVGIYLCKRRAANLTLCTNSPVSPSTERRWDGKMQYKRTSRKISHVLHRMSWCNWWTGQAAENRT